LVPEGSPKGRTRDSCSDARSTGTNPSSTSFLNEPIVGHLCRERRELSNGFLDGKSDLAGGLINVSEPMSFVNHGQIPWRLSEIRPGEALICGRQMLLFEGIFEANSRSPFCMIFDCKIEEKIRGGYAESLKTGLSLLISMVPAGGIEPAPGIHNT
jgi:hypothetical protein